MVDAPDSKSGTERCVGSSPTSGTTPPLSIQAQHPPVVRMQDVLRLGVTLDVGGEERADRDHRQAPLAGRRHSTRRARPTSGSPTRAPRGRSSRTRSRRARRSPMTRCSTRGRRARFADTDASSNAPRQGRVARKRRAALFAHREGSGHLRDLRRCGRSRSLIDTHGRVGRAPSVSLIHVMNYA